jgi:hypothetical protein
MALTKVGLNLSALENVTQPNITITTNPTNLINEIPIKANNYVGNYLGLGILVTLCFLLYYFLSDVGGSGLHRYSQFRSIAIATGLTGVVGMLMVMMGYFTNIIIVGSFLTIFTLMAWWIYKEEK